jgi:hypothetical protein
MKRSAKANSVNVSSAAKPGRHGEHLNEPNVRVLAEKLRACIAAVETRKL